MRILKLLMGLPLAGKTTYIQRELSGSGAIYISADDIKESHPNYDPNNADKLHSWSVKEAERWLYEEAHHGVDIIFDSGSINRNYTVRIINRMRDFGYSIKLIHIKTPYQICIERNKHRTRKVPVSDIMDKAVIENAQFHRLKELVDDFEVVRYFTNTQIFIDMDGVIAALSTLPVVNGEVDFVNGEVHKHLKPVTPVIDKLLQIDPNKYTLHILSATPTSISYEEKNEWLDKHFNIPKERRFFVNSGKYKSEMLDNLVKKLDLDKKDVLMIDDTHQILYDVINRGMNSMHVSELLVHDFK